MKNFWGFLLVVMIGLAACEGPMGPEGPAGLNGADGRNGRDGTNGRDGRDGRDGTDGRDGRNGTDGQDGESANWFIMDFEVLSEHWTPVFDDLIGDIFIFEFPITELTGFVFDYGAVVCHLIQNVNNEPVQTPLPYTFYGEDDGYFYSENYSYEIRPGFITFIVKISDFNTQVKQPLKCTFRVVLMW